MDFFTDAYDFFIIGVVLKLLKSEWHIGSLEMAIVGATSLVSAAIGSAIFGRVADVFGRKYIYGFEVLVPALARSLPPSHPTSSGWSYSPRFQQLSEGNTDTLAQKAKKSGFISALKETFGNDKQLWRWLAGTSLAWFFLDLAYYGNTISNQQFVSAVSPHSNLIHDLFLSLLGFAMMAATFVGIAFIGDAISIVPFILMYGLNYFFTEFGPNTTTFVMPAELFPAKVRTTSHGISATVGKVGAAVGTFTFHCFKRISDCRDRCGSQGLPRSPGWVSRGRSCRNPKVSASRRRRGTNPSKPSTGYSRRRKASSRVAQLSPRQ